MVLKSHYPDNLDISQIVNFKQDKTIISIHFGYLEIDTLYNYGSMKNVPSKTGRPEDTLFHDLGVQLFR